jgi:16S rRNA (cytidine1402-2'-O)-methyltransferase
VSSLGKLYLLPVPIGDEQGLALIPEINLTICRKLTHFIAEDEKQARKYLKLFTYPDISQAQIQLLNEHTTPSEVSPLLKPLFEGNDVGLMSDAGCPGIADPGADVVKLAHQRGVQVIPLVGPSSIVLSIMASGFNGQNFAFNGYLPIEKAPRTKRIRELEQICQKTKQAQFFIETPYRNNHVFDSLLELLSPSSLVFVGKTIGEASQSLKSASVAEWKRAPRPDLHKMPVVFGIGC